VVPFRSGDSFLVLRFSPKNAEQELEQENILGTEQDYPSFL